MNSVTASGRRNQSSFKHILLSKKTNNRVGPQVLPTLVSNLPFKQIVNKVTHHNNFTII